MKRIIRRIVPILVMAMIFALPMVSFAANGRVTDLESKSQNGIVTINGTDWEVDSDAYIANYVSQVETMPYGAGYVASLYLGMKAANASIDNVTSANIVTGLRKIVKDLADGKTLDEAIADNTDFNGLDDFVNKFKAADGDVITFVRNLRTAIGTTGAGSVLSSGTLSTSQIDMFKESTFDTTDNNFELEE